ncbi:MAG: haloacid dehalogenase type II [Burkholderiales bacterium]
MKAIVFDAYGTLFDVYSVAAACEHHFPGRSADLSRLWRAKQLEYTWLRSLMGRYADFEQVTAEALTHSCAALGLTLMGRDRDALMDAYLHLAPYPEVPATLDALAGRPRLVLSNGSPGMLNAVVANAGLASRLDAVLSVDSLGIYKPHPSVYAMVTHRLGRTADDIAFVSSNFWDIAGATSFGFRTFWINRAGLPPDPLGVEPVATLKSLGDLLPHLA